MLLLYSVLCECVNDWIQTWEFISPTLTQTLEAVLWCVSFGGSVTSAVPPSCHFSPLLHRSLKCDGTSDRHLPGKGDWETLPCLKNLINTDVPVQLGLLLRKLFGNFSWIQAGFRRMYASIAVLYCCKSCLLQLFRKSENWRQSLNSLFKLCLLFSVMNSVRV